jgi:hypothetical protein
VPSNGHPLKEDIDMPSSPFRSSPAPRPSELIGDTPTLTITLVREEELAGEWLDGTFRSYTHRSRTASLIRVHHIHSCLQSWPKHPQGLPNHFPRP